MSAWARIASVDISIGKWQTSVCYRTDLGALVFRLVSIIVTGSAGKRPISTFVIWALSRVKEPTNDCDEIKVFIS